MKYISIILGKFAIFIGKKFNRGSSLPGKIALKINKNIMKHFKLPGKIIAVTGSNGKGSCSKMIAEIFRRDGYSVAHNISGSNTHFGIISLLLENCTLSGKITSDVIVYEIDERYTQKVFPYIKPNTVVVTVITRDQPPRQGNHDIITDIIKNSLTKDMDIILNADDPYLQKLDLENNFKKTYYSIEKNEYSFKENIFSNLNIKYCPYCNKKLEFEYFNCENIGSYNCPSKDFSNPKSEYIITNLNYKKKEITINNKYKMNVPYDMIYMIYNVLAAFTTTAKMGIKPKTIVDVLNKISKEQSSYNYNQYGFNKRKVYALSNKNENNSSFNHSLLYTKRNHNIKTIIISWKEISRRYKFNDLSWLYDVEFEILKDQKIDKIICCGINRFDIATRLKYAGISENKIIIFNPLNEAVNYIKEHTKGDIYAILNFDHIKPFNNYMKGEIK